MTVSVLELPFGDVLEDVSAGSYKTPQSEFMPVGQFPVVDQGKSLIAGFVDDASRLCRATLPVIVFGDHTRCFKFVDFPFCMGADGIKVLRPKTNADEKYLYYFLRGLRMPDAGYDRHFKYLKRTSIRLPPLPEQRSIAAILDKADELRAKRRAALERLNGLTQAMFLEMFGDPDVNPQHWDIKPVAAYVEAFQGGKSVEAETGENVVTRNRVLKVSAVTQMEFLPNESKPVPDSYEPPADHFVRSGDLLFSRANTTDLVGAVAHVKAAPANVLLPDKLWRFVWRTPIVVEPLFVWVLFQTASMRRELGRRATGTSGSMKNISQAKVLSIRTILPPLALQRAFAQRVAAVEGLKARQGVAGSLLESLFTTLQHRAFSGAL